MLLTTIVYKYTVHQNSFFNKYLSF